MMFDEGKPPPRFPKLRKMFSCTKVQFAKVAFTVTCLLLLTLVYMGVMLHYVCYPFIAKSKGLNPTKVGIVMGLFPFVNIFTFPISGVLISRMNIKVTFATSAIVQCLLFSLFGLIPSMSRLPFEIYSYLFPIIFSFPVAFFYSSTYSLLQLVFPKHATLILTVQYVFFSSAYLMGPPVGSILYYLIGFLPMFVLFSVAGILVAIVAILMLYYSPINTKLNTKKKESPSPLLIFKILLTPSISFNLLFIFITSSHYFYFLPVMGPYIASRYNVGVITIGALLMVSEVSHLIVALPLGYIMNKWSSPLYYFFIVNGLVIHSIGIFLYVPSSIVFPTTGDYLPLCFVANLIIGIGFALSYIPAMSVSLKRGEKKFPSFPTSTSTIVSGLITGIYSMGESAGPVAAGIIAEFWVLDVVTFYLSIIVSIAAAVAFIAMLVSGELKQVLISRNNLCCKIKQLVRMMSNT